MNTDSIIICISNTRRSIQLSLMLLSIVEMIYLSTLNKPLFRTVLEEKVNHLLNVILI